MFSKKCIVNPEMDCLGIKEAQRVEEELHRLNDENKDAHKELREQITEVDKETARQGEQIASLTSTANETKGIAQETLEAVRQLKPKAESVESVKSDIEKLDSRIDAIEQKPGKSWEDAKSKFFLGIVGAFATACAGGLFWLLAQQVH